jgi:hypothetical protein
MRSIRKGHSKLVTVPLSVVYLMISKKFAKSFSLEVTVKFAKRIYNMDDVLREEYM